MRPSLTWRSRFVRYRRGRRAVCGQRRSLRGRAVLASGLLPMAWSNSLRVTGRRPSVYLGLTDDSRRGMQRVASVGGRLAFAARRGLAHVSRVSGDFPAAVEAAGRLGWAAPSGAGECGGRMPPERPTVNQSRIASPSMQRSVAARSGSTTVNATRDRGTPVAEQLRGTSVLSTGEVEQLPAPGRSAARRCPRSPPSPLVRSWPRHPLSDHATALRRRCCAGLCSASRRRRTTPGKG